MANNQVEVLESIRDLLSGKDTKTSPEENVPAENDDDAEILDLTMLLNDDGSVTDLEAPNLENSENTEEEKVMATNDEKKGQDVLDEIDKLLADGDSGTAVASAPDAMDSFDNAAITDETVEIELATMKDNIAAEETSAEDDGFAPIEMPASQPAADDMEALISDAAAAQAKSAISELVSKAGKPATPVRASSPAPSFRNGDTVEDLVMEGLKPMLKIWLDENLPSLVEEIVQREIAKLIPR